MAEPIAYLNGQYVSNSQCVLPIYDAGIVLDPDSPTRLADIDLSPVILTLLVGPEGGLTRDEAEAAQRNGFIAAATGPRTLRTETAALTGLALAQARWGDL